MPQLDKVHFFSQYFWLCVFYFGFYFLISKHFLPAMARVLQLRKDKCSHTPQESADSELKNVQESGNTVLDNIFSTSHKFWSQNSRRISDWYGGKVLNCNQNYLRECNKLYIKKVGDYSLSQNAALVALQAATNSPYYTPLLLRQCTKSYPSLDLPADLLVLSSNLTKKASKKKSRPMNGEKKLSSTTTSSAPQDGKRSKKKKL